MITRAAAAELEAGGGAPPPPLLGGGAPTTIAALFGATVDGSESALARFMTVDQTGTRRAGITHTRMNVTLNLIVGQETNE